MTETRLTPAESAARVLEELLAVQPGEMVAIVTDDDSPGQMIDALVRALGDGGNEYAVLRQPSRSPAQKNRLNPAIARALEAADVLIALTMSGGAPIYSAEIKALLDARRLRMMSMVMRDMDIFTGGGALADYRALRSECERLQEIWRGGSLMEITSAAGTRISAPIGADRVIVECGYARRPGQSAAFSDGEVSSRPLQGQASGVFVIDGPAAEIGAPERPIAVVVRDGRVVAIEGTGIAADRLRRIVETVEHADNIAEFGIGMNPACRRNGKFEEEKKRRGQVHIAIGDNIFFGGNVESAIHMDLVVLDPTVRLDGRVLVEAGEVRLG